MDTNQRVSSTMVILISLLAPALASCGTTLEGIIEQGEIVGVTKIDNSEGESHSTISICQRFSLSDEEIREFFLTAESLSAEAQQLAYLSLPCSFEGEFHYGGSSHWFSVNAGQSGVVELHDSSYAYFGCKENCSELFGTSLYVDDE